MNTKTLAAIVVLVAGVLAAVWLYADRAGDAQHGNSVPALEPGGGSITTDRTPVETLVRAREAIAPPVVVLEPLTSAELAALPTNETLEQRYDGMTREDLTVARDHLTRVVSDHKNGRVAKITLMPPDRIRALEHEVRWLETRLQNQ